jgi:hypothetical protein
MKKLLSFLLLAAACSLTSIRADDCCANTEATAQQRLRDIDLNIALKMYEQIQTERAKAELQLVLVETDSDAPETERKKRIDQLRNRVEILKVHADQARARVLDLGKAVSVAAN